MPRFSSLAWHQRLLLAPFPWALIHAWAKENCSAKRSFSLKFFLWTLLALAYTAALDCIAFVYHFWIPWTNGSGVLELLLALGLLL
jgi:hypothetical protein